MLSSSRFLAVIIGAFALLLISTACAPAAQTDSEQGATTETPATSTASSVIVEPATSGEALFADKGCASCHGANAGGTAIAPGLAGHSETQVRRQVRAPVGIMPPFSPDVISNEELDAITEFVLSLGEGHMHEMASGTGDAVSQHHWMALFALEDGNIVEGEHHISHIIELTEGIHREQMEAALASLRASDTHDAEHTVQNMLAGVAEADLSIDQMHLRMALSGLQVDAVNEALHHLEHALAVATDPAHEARLQEITTLISQDDHESASDELMEALGMDAHDDGDEHDEGADDY